MRKILSVLSLVTLFIASGIVFSDAFVPMFTSAQVEREGTISADGALALLMGSGETEFMFIGGANYVPVKNLEVKGRLSLWMLKQKEQGGKTKTRATFGVGGGAKYKFNTQKIDVGMGGDLNLHFPKGGTITTVNIYGIVGKKLEKIAPYGGGGLCLISYKGGSDTYFDIFGGLKFPFSRHLSFLTGLDLLLGSETQVLISGGINYKF